MKLTYDPSVFATTTLPEARRIILTQEGELDTERRWERETPYLARLLGESLELTPNNLVIDYGCGVGRLSKAIIEMFGCMVLGVDISEEMRGLAPGYVRSPRFSAISRNMLHALAESGVRAHAALGVWVLQHCVNPTEDLRLITNSMRDEGRIAVVNSISRFVPTTEKGWTNDGVDIRNLLRAELNKENAIDLDASSIGRDLAKTAFFEIYSKRSS